MKYSDITVFKLHLFVAVISPYTPPFLPQLDASAPGCLHFIPRLHSSALATPVHVQDADVRSVLLGRPLFAVHLCNAFQKLDSGASSVVVDLCAFRTFELGHEFGYRGPQKRLKPIGSGASESLLRVVVPVAAMTGISGATSLVGDAASKVKLSELCSDATCVCDFPRVAAAAEGRDAPCVFVAGRRAESSCDIFDCVARIDLPGHGRPMSDPNPLASRDLDAAVSADCDSTMPLNTQPAGGSCSSSVIPTTNLDVWQAPEGTFVGEPLFVPSPSGGVEPISGSCVIAVLYRGSDATVESASSSSAGGRTELAVFNASAIAAGPIARVAMPLYPYAFHGTWMPAVKQPADAL